jgi:hypothetical protein
VETLPADAVNVVEFVPDGIMIELDPSSSSVLLLDSKTSVPPTGAAPLKVTVHVVEAAEFKLFGLQVNWETEICPKAPLEIAKASIPVIMTVMIPFMNSSHNNNLANELIIVSTRSARPRFSDQQAVLPVGSVNRRAVSVKDIRPEP